MEYRYLINGQWRRSQTVDPVIFPYSGETVAEVYQTPINELDEAIGVAARGFQLTRKLPTHKRYDILMNFARIMQERADSLIDAMVLEGGKPKKVARGEHARAIQTITAAAEEAKRIGGEIISMDWTPVAENRLGMVRHFPLGPVLGITPFNYPVNLGCHKLGPAIAAGNSFVLKPAEDTPLSSVLMGEMLLEAGIPAEALGIVMAEGRQAEPLARDERFKFLSFTGSSEVGWYLKSIAGRKRVGLELGGNAGIIVHNDANLDYAVDRCVMGAFTNSGQNCISVQRIIVQENVADEFTHRIVEKTKQLKMGDPRDEATDVGPMIRMKDAERVEIWLNEARSEGAHVVLGGERDGIMIQPTILNNVTPDMRVGCQEVFAPVVSIMTYKTFDEALKLANATDYGLQGGLFTQDINRVMQAFEEFEVGGLQVNDVSTFRVDHMPYGGVKSSGIGREGVRYAIEEMTEMKLMVVNLGGGLPS